MGLTNAPAMFMWMMNNLFEDMLDQGVVVFLDDMLIYSTTSEGHFKLLEKVFVCLWRYKFYCKLKKCSFLQWTTTFLGFDISPEGLQISDAKIRSLKEWPKPTTIQQVQLFLGFVQFFRKFIKGFSKIAEPLHCANMKRHQFCMEWVIGQCIWTAKVVHDDGAHTRNLQWLPWHPAWSTHGCQCQSPWSSTLTEMHHGSEFPSCSIF